MTSGLSKESSRIKLQWQEVGAWQAGTVGAVALDMASGEVRGLLASRAGVYQWQQPGTPIKPLTKGLSDLHVVAVAFAGGDAKTPAIALAATATGRLFCQRDSSAEVWQEITSWAGLGVAVTLAPSPTFSEDRTLFVGTPMGIFRTRDEGQSWESCNFGLLDEEVLCLICAPTFAQSEVLWAGTAGGGLYRSRNSGRAWRDSGFGLPDAAAQCLAVSPNFEVDRTVFVGMEGNGIYISHDSGESWSQMALAGRSINALALAGADFLWAGTEDGLWRVNVKSGECIQVIGAGEVVMSVAAMPTGQVAAGFFGSGICILDESIGATESIKWQRPKVALHAPPIVSRSGDTLVALDADGLLARSSDQGASWVEISSAHPDGVFAAAGLEVNGRGESLFVATSAGVSRWSDEMKEWQELSGNLPPETILIAIELSPSFEHDQTMLGIDQDNLLHLSQDGGVKWRRLTGDWQGQSVMRALFASDNPNELVTLTMQPTATGHFNLTLWQSQDRGETWEVLAGLTSGIPSATIVWPKDSKEKAIYLGTQHRVIKLFQAGEGSDLQLYQHFFDESFSITALAVSPDYADDSTIWAATTGGLFVSNDWGMNWSLVLELPQDLPVLWLEVTPTSLNAVTIGGRIWHAEL